MIKIQVEGQVQQVQPFIFDLQQRPQIELLYKEIVNKEVSLHDEICIKCYVRHQPERRVKVVQMVTTEGMEIQIPLLDLIQVETEEGLKVITGRVFDIFS